MRPDARHALRFLPALLALAACSGTNETFEPTVSVRGLPATVTGGGDETDLKVTATDSAGRPGRGTVTLVATHGAFPATDGGYVLVDGGLQPITTLTLDSAGNAWTTYACDVLKDGECHDGLTVKVTGIWNGVDAGSRPLDIVITGCGIPDAGHPPIAAHVCAPPTTNECDGTADSFLSGAGVPASGLNGSGGNGFDDDCDGLVDEGCGCTGSGQSRDCWLVPATQVDAVSRLPVGWCSPNARGSMSCNFVNGTGSWAEDQGQPNCRGAKAPAVNDSCGDTDFNCDGLKGNNALQGCWCEAGVQCPSAAITLAPYPDPGKLPSLDAGGWFTTAAARGRATNWRWTVVGGDCDNVLPNPTFALFSGASTAGARLGTRTTVTYDPLAAPPRYVADPTSPLVGLVADRASLGVNPAFALSGDYVVQGEFDLNGKHFVCTQKVQVRAPGLRAELCWDTAGTVDIDLHLARLQLVDGGVLQPTDGGPPACAGGWDNSGCPDLDANWKAVKPDWGYVTSDRALPDGGIDHGACVGWGSKGTAPCNNPRLDRDNISCTVAQADPAAGDFCGPENINLDYPRDGERFVVGANYFGGGAFGWVDGGADAGTDGGLVRVLLPNHPHVNIYCNGVRILSSGYNPLSGQTDYPALLQAGGDSSGDFWTVATVTTVVDGGVLVACQVDPIPSRHADQDRDGVPNTGDGGTTDFCVDSTSNRSPAPFTFSYASHLFVEARDAGQGLPAGYIPFSPQQWCKH